MNISENKLAQLEGDSSKNEANRIRERETVVKQTWRSFVYINENNPTAEQVSCLASKLYGSYLGPEYCSMICERGGFLLK